MIRHALAIPGASSASLCLPRRPCTPCSRCRTLTTSAGPTSPAAEAPVGGFRGTLNGFLLGFGVVSAAGAAWVLQGQTAAAERVAATADQLERNTATLAEHLNKVHRLETDLAALKGVSIPRSEQQGRKDALDQLYQGLREDVDSASTRLVRLEREVGAVMKRVPKEQPTVPRRIV